MKEFKYNPAELTKEQLEKIESAKNVYETTVKALQEEEEERAQRYYDCVDDYSYGGICSKVNAMKQNQAYAWLQARIESIVRGGFLLKEKRVNVLRDIETNKELAVGTRCGRYGRFYVTYDGRFISCAERLGTYQKKGVIPLVRTITEKVKIAGYWRNGDVKFEVIEKVSETEEISTEIVY